MSWPRGRGLIGGVEHRIIDDRITQRWWNGHWGMASERLRIHVHTLDDESEHWSIERTSAENDNQRLAYPCISERQALERLKHLQEEIGGEWRRVDDQALNSGD